MTTSFTSTFSLPDIYDFDTIQLSPWWEYTRRILKKVHFELEEGESVMGVKLLTLLVVLTEIGIVAGVLFQKAGVSYD
jgi:hypothetical protein